MTEPRTEQETARFRYRCYVEAYTQARTGAIVRSGYVIRHLTRHTTAFRADYEDLSLARAVALGASDGVHGRARPHTQPGFERMMRESSGETESTNDAR